MQIDSFCQLLLEQVHDGIYCVDTNRRITYWNNRAERITGYSRQEVTGHCCSDNLLRHIDRQGTELCLRGCPLTATLKDGQVREADVFLHHKEGHRVPISVRVVPIYAESGELTGAAEIFTDRSRHGEILSTLESLRKEVLVDHLTGIGNRKYAELELKNRLNDLTALHIPFGLLFIDIDHFKKVNDQFGHPAGDKVLTMVAKTITNVLRSRDTVARWGGEEFVVIAPGRDSVGMLQIAERIRAFIEQSWLNIGECQVRVTVSIGGASACPDDSIATLVKRADDLMYASKRNGRNRTTLEKG